MFVRRSESQKESFSQFWCDHHAVCLIMRTKSVFGALMRASFLLPSRVSHGAGFSCISA
jgi:hypothetical protein